MALAISNIPVLSGEAARRFVRDAEENARRRGCVGFASVRREWRDFEVNNDRRIEALKKAGKWPF